MADFLLELLSEEIPARMQARACADLERLLREELAAAGLAAERIETYATPRRLALIARGLPAETAAVREETKGPRTTAPVQALEGFLRKTGLSQDQLVERDGAWFAEVERPGRATAALLAEAVPAIVRAFPWPKSMRWGEGETRWVRPLQGIVALFGEEIVALEVAGLRSGAATIGHRFHHPGIITIGSAADYAEKLRACHVILDPAERRRIIAEGAAAAARAAGLALVEDEGLLAENAGLTEWPVPLLGKFDPAFLDVPREVIQLTMRTNQKYFALTHSREELAPNFVCVANIEASDGGAAIAQGNERVLSARLADAKFFWEQDLKIPLEEQAKKLSQIVFHDKLGTLADKVERVAKLARWLVEEGVVGGSSSPGRGGGPPAKPGVEGSRLSAASESGPLHQPAAGPPPRPGEDLAALAERAARLCKADLVTGLVGEFPELQGIVGGHLARAQSEPDEIADAIRDHYKPVGQGDEVPTAPVTVAVGLADKLDTLLSFFDIGELPTGSKDPFALRRSSLGILRLILDNQLELHTDSPIEAWLGQSDTTLELDEAARDRRRLLSQIPDFLADRLEVQLRESGVRHDFVRASVRWSARTDGRLDRVAARARALQSFVETPEGADLLAGYKRAANILKKENYVTPAKAGVHAESGQSGSPEGMPASAGMTTGEQGRNISLSYTPEKEEEALIAALDSAEPRARAAVEAEDFEGAMAALASLRAPVDSFFDKVTVNDPDPAKRAARLDLLARMRDAVHAVADFSKIEG